MIRKFLRLFLAAPTAILLSLHSSIGLANDDIQAFAVSNNTLFDLNLTQLTSSTASSLAATTSAIATRESDGRLFAYGGASTRYFYFWESASDTTTLVRSYTGSERLDVTRMGFAADGTLYLSDADERLYTIDTNSGTVTLLGTMSGLATGPYEATGDLAFSAEGTLYINNYRSLYTVDLATLVATEIFTDMITSPVPTDVAVWTGLAICEGQMYASSAEVRTGQAGIFSGLYNIDPQSGLDTYLYDADAQLRDMADCVDGQTGGSNTAPVAVNQSLNTNIDVALNVILQGQDADNDPLSYSIESPPVNGALVGSGNTYTYTPNAGYSGSDSFSFIVDDGLLSSDVATVTIQIGGPSSADLIIYGANAYGVDQMVALNLTQNTASVVAALPFGTQAMARDPQSGFVYFYEWEYAASRFAYWNPANGEFTVVRTYSPVNGFYAKRMDFAPDGTLYLSDDQEGLYTIDKISGDVTYLGAVTGLENGIWAATGDMTFTPDGTLWVSNYRTLSSINLQTLVATPVFTNLIGTAPLVPYDDAVLTGIAYCDGAFYTTSAERVSGDSGVFRVNATTGAETFLFYAQTLLNDTTSCSINGFPSNIAPVANDLVASTVQDEPVVVVLQASDADGDALVLSIYNSPANGTLSGSDSTYTYTPNNGFTGADSFQYIASDGLSASNIATVTLSIDPLEPENTAPVAQSQSLETEVETPLPITLSGTDAEGDALSFSIVTQPPNGVLTGASDSYTYTPNAGFSGVDSFEFQVNDGELNSNIATVSVQVDPVVNGNQSPEAFAQQVVTSQDESVAITLVASDPENDPLSFTVIGQPVNGSLTGTGATLTYLPSPGYIGPDSFSFRANDGTSDSNLAVVTISVESSGVLPQGIFGANGDGNLLDLDMTQLTASVIGDLPFGSSAIALDPSNGRLYFYGGGSQRFLVYRDPVSGGLTQVQSYQGSARLDAVRMDFSPDGTLYMSDALERLYTLDKESGTVTLLGTMSGLETGAYGATGDMMFSADGTLWIANYRSLYTLDLNSLVATQVHTAMISSTGANDIALWSGLALCNGQVYASTLELRDGQSTPVSGLFNIDLQSGADTYLFDAPALLNDLSSCN